MPGLIFLLLVIGLPLLARAGLWAVGRYNLISRALDVEPDASRVSDSHLGGPRHAAHDVDDEPVDLAAIHAAIPATHSRDYCGECRRRFDLETGLCDHYAWCRENPNRGIASVSGPPAESAEEQERTHKLHITPHRFVNVVPDSGPDIDMILTQTGTWSLDDIEARVALEFAESAR